MTRAPVGAVLSALKTERHYVTVLFRGVAGGGGGHTGWMNIG